MNFLKISRFLFLFIFVSSFSEISAQDFSKKMMTWELGRKLTISAIMNTKDAKEAKDLAQSFYEKSKVIANALEIKNIPALPKRTGKGTDDLVNAINYIISDAGKTIATSLYAKDKSLGSIFEIAAKSHLLMATYSPGGEEGKIIADGIKSLAKQATIPEKLLQPLIDKINAKASFEEVRKSLFEVGDSVSTYLSTQK